MGNSLLSKILANQGESLGDIKSTTRVGQLIRRSGVKPGREFERISALPRRVWEEDPELEQLIDALTSRFKTPKGTQRLRPHQAVGLAELMILGRFVADFPVGAGKTLITFLAPAALGSKRVLLLVPANLVEKTRKEFRALAEHWQGCRTIEIMSYEKLSRAKQANFLEQFNPDLILADEVYALKNASSGRTKRVKRHMKSHKGQVRFIPLSGTFWKNSVHDYAHISEWSMDDSSPVPHTSSGAFIELQEWACAVDVKPREQRLAAGVLASFTDVAEPELDDIRAGLARRRNETPGWVRVSSSGVDASLVLEGIRFDDYHSSIDDKFWELRHEWQTPSGDVFVEPQKLWSYLRSCSLGFEYYLDPKPPEHWTEARKEWGKLVREWLDRTVDGVHLETEFQVASACSRGLIRDYGVYDRWVKVRPIYDPEKHRKTFWFDESVVKWAQKWLKTEQGIIFTPFKAFGFKMAEVSGLPYFGEQGSDKKAGSIEDYAGGPCIASIQSNMRGRNLQNRWARALVVGGIGSGPDAEQLIGRMHRSGQEADLVQYDFLYGCYETLKMLWGAREEAKFSNDPNHKLILGDWNIDTLEDAETWSGSRWATNQ